MEKIKFSRKKIKAIAVMLCICLIAGMAMNQAGIVQLTRAEEQVWGGGALPEANAGYTFNTTKNGGTAAQPYKIITAADLSQFVANVNAGVYEGKTPYFTLENDFNLNNNEWVPVGNDDYPFTGVFNGNGKKITYMQITITSGNSGILGFFGYTKNAKISNLVVNGTITQKDTQTGNNVGGLIGYAESTDVDSCAYVGHVVGVNYVGGLVGACYGSSTSNCTISNSYCGSGTITGSKYSVGGLVGDARYLTMINCYNRGCNVTLSGATTDSKVAAGGLVGYATQSYVINSYNTANVNSAYVAGGIGNGSSLTVKNCYNIGTVAGSSLVTGAISGSTGSNVFENAFYLTSSASASIPGGASASVRNVGTFDTVSDTCYVVRDAKTEESQWTYTASTSLLTALATGVTSLSNTYSTILEWGRDTKVINSNAPIHTAVIGHAHDQNGGDTYLLYPTCTNTGILLKKCSKCDYTTEHVVAKSEHSYVKNPQQEPTILKDATCTEDGQAAYVCTNVDRNNEDAVCGHQSEIFAIPASGHDLKTVTHEAVCAADGYAADECQNAGCEYFENKVVLPMVGHNYKGTVTAATCTDAERCTYVCQNSFKSGKCEDTYVVTTGTALGHDWDSVSGKAVESTCIEAGGMLKTCRRCSHSEFVGERFELSGHDYNIVTTDPTCTEDGFTEYTCKVCKVYYKKDYVDAKGHEDVIVEVVKPTCAEDGYTVHECLECGHTYSDTVVPATGKHNYVTDESKSKLASCFTDGWITSVCSVCNDSKRQIIYAPGKHDWYHNVEKSVAQTCTTGGYDVSTCALCLEEEHFNVTEEGFGHSPEEHVHEPSCIDAGYKEYICSICQHSEIGESIPALGHSFEAVVTAPTTTTRGYTTYSCSRCQESYESDYVAATPNGSYSILEQKLILSDIDELMTYSLDGGVSWTAVEVSSVSVSVEAIDVSHGIWVQRPGNDVLPLSSSVIQVIQVAKAPTPSDIIGVDPKHEEDLGMILGLSTAMEFKKAEDTVWQDVTSELMENLAPGVYHFRIKATENSLASDIVEIVIKEYEPEPTPGPTEESTPTPEPTGESTPTPIPSGKPTLAPSGTPKPTSPSNNGGNNNGGNNNNNSGNNNVTNNGNNNNNSGNNSNGSNLNNNNNKNNTPTQTQKPGIIQSHVYYNSNGGAIKSPKTGDSADGMIWLMLAAASITAIGVVVKKRKVDARG